MSTTASASDSIPSGRQQAAIMSAVAREVSSATSLYAIGMGAALPAGLISAIITVQYLSPAQFGQLGLLMVLAGFLTQLYNVGLLHGTFLWVYGSSGDGGDDVEFEGQARANAVTQRTAMGTGVILTLIVVSCGTVVCFIFAKPLAQLLGLGPRHANWIGVAAISGAAGSIFRLTSNVFRFERRPRTFAIAMISRPIGVLIFSTGLVIVGYGVAGAVVGTAIPSLLCAVGCMMATRRSYSFAFSAADARQIVIRGSSVVLPVLALWVLHNGDLYLLTHWVSGSKLGVYRLASRLGAPPSYFASAFVMTWTPLERSALVQAAFQARGRFPVRTLVTRYYLIVGFSIVVIFVLFSRAFLLVAPHSYAEAGKLAPVIALAFVMYGAYIVLMRTARPDPMLVWYAVTAVFAAVVFVGAAFVLIPALGAYGAPAALSVGALAGCALVLWRNTRSKEPLPMEYGRILRCLAVAGATCGAAIAGNHFGRVISLSVTTLAALAYVPALVWFNVIPRSHLRLVGKIVSINRGGIRTDPARLPPAEQLALARFRAGELELTDTEAEHARLTRALRRLGGVGQPSAEDQQIGSYLASREPEAIRDFQLEELIEHGVDPYELHQLDRLAKAVRRSRVKHEVGNWPSRRQLRARVRALADQEHAELAEALAAMPGLSRPNGHRRPTRDVEAVRALRAVRRSLELGVASGADPVLARALWGSAAPELTGAERAELRRLKRLSRLAAKAARERERRKH